MNPIRSFLQGVRDPFGFAEALRGLTLQPADLPALSREDRLGGSGQ